jgi:hypothetical protein
MTNSITVDDLYTFDIGKHGTARTVAVICIATGQVIARFDFEEDEVHARRQAMKFAEGLATIYSSGASLDTHGILVSDEHLDRKYCWPIEHVS